ncbi:MAG: hypothetical protein ETSY2_25820, partial [Candidatus Entotheonella gemina]
MCFESKPLMDVNKALLSDLKRLLRRLETDLRQRAEATDDNPMHEALQREYGAAQDAQRTREAFETWREGVLTQAGVAWLLGCVFVRFLEDNGLVEPALIAGPGQRGRQARERQSEYDRQNPLAGDRGYLYDVFHTVRQLPAMAGLFDLDHNPLWAYEISTDAAKALIEFWRQIDPETGELVHDFTDCEWNTRFLGDLYQDLSDAARNRYALLQTPEFVESFILDRTLEPALEEFGLHDVRLIDPTCGSGHFLLGTFHRLLDKWRRIAPAVVERELVQRALDAVYGVDVNPFAVTITRFRLLIAALLASGIRKLSEAPGFRLQVTVGDSLLQGPEGMQHVYGTENLAELNRILGQRYHAVVGNPPYITVKDKALSQLYRDRYKTCHRQYSLGVPFTERFFQLANEGEDGQRAGYVGMITANSFMKREFGKKLIETFFPRIDLTHVIDTSGVKGIPGHNTPTVILFGRNRRPIGREVRAVLGIRGEPSTPVEPSQGLVWQSIIEQIDMETWQNEFVSITNMPRETFAKHPWSLDGGGAASLRTLLEVGAESTLYDIGADIGFLVITGEDNCLILESDVAHRHGLTHIMPVSIGEVIRNWDCSTNLFTLWPNSDSGEHLPYNDISDILNFLWPYRTSLKNRKAFGIPVEEKGLSWWALRELYTQRLRPPLTITFAFVATHNHFVFNRGDKVFNRTAPIIKLPSETTEESHLALIGLLNSSTACFWGRQVFFPKGGFSAGKWEEPHSIGFSGSEVQCRTDNLLKSGFA